MEYFTVPDTMPTQVTRLAHGWTLSRPADLPAALLREFIRPAIRALPPSMAGRLGACRVSLRTEPQTLIASKWTVRKAGVDVQVMTAGLEEHDATMELLLCLGQFLWEKLSTRELKVYWTLLGQELAAGVPGEIDEQALEAKRALLSPHSHAGRLRRLHSYGRASFSGTAAEYVHCLWHEVTIRRGPDYLPAAPLRRRLELLASWFPPGKGYRLFPAQPNPRVP